MCVHLSLMYMERFFLFCFVLFLSSLEDRALMSKGTSPEFRFCGSVALWTCVPAKADLVSTCEAAMTPTLAPL